MTLVLLLSAVLLGAAGAAERSAFVSGIERTVEVRRDIDGIPHVYADKERDAYFSLGYVHAEDRLWQMEISRRSGSGTLAELVGDKALSQDRLIRTLGLRRVAAQNLDHLDNDTRELLRAYAAGVNAYVSGASVLPPEFLVLGAKPSPWTPIDSVVILKMLAWTLSGNWWEELLNVRLRERLSARQFVELFPPYPGDPSVLLPDPSTLYGRLSSVSGALRWAGHRPRHVSLGSNNWVVSGLRAKHGKPLLANDPHTPLTAPSMWYLAHLHAPGLNVIGATVPGTPGVLLGRNEGVAWAFTNTGPDTQDLYVERVSADDANRYETPSGEAAFEQLSEIIAVRSGEAQRLPVRISRHGPVISDVVEEASGIAPQGTVLALSWIGLQAEDQTARFMLSAARAANASDLRAAARFLDTPQQNLVYADVAGAIGFVAAGRVPVRKKRNQLNGLMPAPGWDDRYDWAGVIPFERLPAVENPAGGTIVTANQKITPPDYPYWITSGWFPPLRADRIDKLLQQSSQHDVASFAAIQSDVRNPVADDLLPYLLRHEPARRDAAEVMRRLQNWDRRMTPQSMEALVFVEWTRRLDARLLKPRLGALYDWVDDYNPLFLSGVLSRPDDPSGWCGAPDAGRSDPCREAVESALNEALDELARRYGNDRSTWTWGRAHITRSTHLPAGAAGFLSQWLDFELPGVGARDTINVSGYAFDAESGLYISETGASFRAIYDLGDPRESVFVLNTGQSGNPLSRHYGDMVGKWQAGRYIPMRMDREEIVRHTRDVLSMRPG